MLELVVAVAVLRFSFYNEKVWRSPNPPHVVRHDPMNKNVPQHVPRHVVVVGGKGNLIVKLADSLQASLLHA
jgi:hypothetical protein